MRIPRLLALPVGAMAALAGAALLAGCGAAPGSVSGDPLAQKLVAAEQQLRGWDAARTTLVFDGSGQLGSTTLPCMSVVSSGEPVESFALQLNKAGSSSSGCREAPATDRDVVTVLYEDGTLYVADAGLTYSEDDEQCTARFTGHRVAGDLADEFLASSTEQARLDDLLKAATAISGTDTRIEMELDTATIVELGATDVPSGGDLDDYDISAVAALDPAGTLTSIEMTISAGNAGALTVESRYEQTTDRPEIPEKSCVDAGSPFTSQAQMESIFR